MIQEGLNMYYVIERGTHYALLLPAETALKVVLELLQYNPDRTVEIYRSTDFERVFVRNRLSPAAEEE